MRMPRLRTVLLTPLVLFAAFYVFFAIKFAVDDDSIAPIESYAYFVKYPVKSFR